MDLLELVLASHENGGGGGGGGGGGSTSSVGIAAIVSLLRTNFFPQIWYEFIAKTAYVYTGAP